MILDEDFIEPSRCDRRTCPTDEQLSLYPMLDEDVLDKVSENLAFCDRCNKRMKAIEQTTPPHSKSNK